MEIKLIRNDDGTYIAICDNPKSQHELHTVQGNSPAEVIGLLVLSWGPQFGILIRMNF